MLTSSTEDEEYKFEYEKGNNHAVTFKQYRTSGLVPTGYGSKKLYAFRYQDIRSVGSVKKKDMNKQLKSAGKWFFNSSPY